MAHWDGIEAFVEVVRLGTFAAAARQLQVSNSHISRQVAQLEQELGLPLLYRTTRQIHLTDAGERYYARCRELLDGFREAETALQSLQERPHGVLRLSCATTFGERFLAPLVNDFLRLHPQLEMRLHLTNRQVDVIDEGYDVVIRMGTLQDSSLIARRLCERRLPAGRELSRLALRGPLLRRIPLRRRRLGAQGRSQPIQRPRQRRSVRHGRRISRQL